MPIYLHDFTFLTSSTEERSIIQQEHRTCFNSFYPCEIFPEKGLERLEFDTVTILYGGNGSGKSTALNIMAAKLGLLRDIPFNPTHFFNQYVERTKFNDSRYSDLKGIPEGSRILCSEDVFDKTLSIRTLNHDINGHREEIAQEWIDVQYHGGGQRRMTSIHGPEYEAYKRTQRMKKKSMSSVIRSEVGLNVVTGSNGENALDFFTAKIQSGALYLLDEPENSLSAKWQVKLAEFLEGMARFERCQFVIATHSPFLLGLHGAKIYDLDTVGVPVRKWTELENVREYFEFFQSRAGEFA